MTGDASAMSEPALSLSEYTGAVEAGWTHQELLRAILHECRDRPAPVSSRNTLPR